ncbi:MAG: GIY-YIG nuclease family protein [Candidatus Pacebacteria bacterium]|nr:GIY-YIG nuclease family protein [Candidatus Paceibacterota bacterium]
MRCGKGEARLEAERRAGKLIYFLRSARTSLIKIGRSSHFRSRYAQLAYEHKENLEILGVVSEDVWEERQLHRIFSEIRVVNEWFENSAVLRDFIAQHATLDLAAVDTPRNEVMVPIDRHIAFQAKKNAENRGIPVHSYLSSLLRQAVDDDFKRI